MIAAIRSAFPMLRFDHYTTVSALFTGARFESEEFETNLEDYEINAARPNKTNVRVALAALLPRRGEAVARLQADPYATQRFIGRTKRLVNFIQRLDVKSFRVFAIRQTRKPAQDIS
jgi:hypothetical protein